MIKTSQLINLMKHGIGGNPDSRLDPVLVANQALSFLCKMHDWKFLTRPPLDMSFQAATAPTAQPISAIARVSNVVTVTLSTAPVPALEVGKPLVVTGVTDTTFNGTFAIVTVVSTTVCTLAQTAGDASSSGGQAGQFAYEQFLDLPADFGELLGICTKNNAISNIVPTSLNEISWRRGYVYATAFDRLYRCAISFPGQLTTSDEQPGPRLEIWPRPTAVASGGDVTINYRAGPITLVYDDTHDSVPNIPAHFERLLVLIARLFIQGYEEDTVDEDPQIKTEVAVLLEADGRVMTQQGQIRGGAAAMKPSFQNRPFSVIANPSNRV